jgi:thiol:disulfide interchange protein
MRKKTVLILWIICIFTVGFCASAGYAAQSNSVSVELVKYEKEISSAHLEPARMGAKSGVAVIFEGTSDLHYYAKAKTAPAAGLELKVEVESDDFSFGQPVFPKWSIFTDPLGKKVEVYVGRFTVFVPIKAATGQSLQEDKLPAEPLEAPAAALGNVVVKISGLACTSMICLPPFERTLQIALDFNQRDSWQQISFESAAAVAKLSIGPSYSILFALGLAFLAGLALNIMPCVWPVLPVIVLRLVEQAKQSKAKSIAMGLVFCLGILLFFACLAGASAVLRLFYGTVLQWGDQFRSPAFVMVMALLLVVLALFMFDVFTVTVPSSVSTKAGSKKGFAGALGMGFLAAILSTPCSFAILAAALAWAQAQPLALGTFAIMVIGLGMAAPYAILTSLPGLLAALPRPGKWMQIFKQAVGFILLFIAVWLIAALPQQRRIGVLYFALALAFCLWMWAGWVDYSTKFSRKLLIRVIAAVLAVAAGLYFLSPSEKLIDWQEYDAELIETSLKNQRPVLIEFTADWCMSCKFIEKVVYSRRDVAELIKQKSVLAIKADTTLKDHPATLALKDVYNEPGVPVSILFLPGRQEPVRWRGKAFAGELKGFLQQLPSR